MDQDIEQQPNPDYLKGFNEGYLITQYMPDIAAKIADAAKDSERSLGFKGGRDQYLKELALDKSPAWLKRDYSSLGKGPKDKSKDDKDKE